MPGAQHQQAQLPLPGVLSALCMYICPVPFSVQVHKINKFCQAQTRSLEQRLNKLQDSAAIADTQREKDALLAVRGQCAAAAAAAAVGGALCACSPFQRIRVVCRAVVGSWGRPRRVQNHTWCSAGCWLLLLQWSCTA